jgi:hypothetical protein
MSKSVKRNNKYYGYDNDFNEDHYEDNSQKLIEKRIRSALRSQNKKAIFDLIEEDY